MAPTGHKTYSMLARYTHLKPENIEKKIAKLKGMKKKSLEIDQKGA